MDFRTEISVYDQACQVGRWRSLTGWITYRVLGSGPGLIVAPGIASTYRGYCALLNDLGRSFQTVILDYPGEHPDDDADLSRINHADLVRNLVGLSDHLNLDRPALFGPSFGSTIVLSALIERPGHFSRSVTQGGFVRRHLGRLERLAFGIGRRVPGTLSRLPFRDTILAIKNKAAFQGEAVDRWPIYLEQNGLTPIGPFSHRLDLVADLDLRARLRDTSAEVLAIQGEADNIIVRAQWQELCDSIPNAKGKLWTGVGHQPHYTHPLELASMIRNWVLQGLA